MVAAVAAAIVAMVIWRSAVVPFARALLNVFGSVAAAMPLRLPLPGPWLLQSVIAARARCSKC
eukprot:12482502-Alexandrium_andersonii.AAC.1